MTVTTSPAAPRRLFLRAYCVKCKVVTRMVPKRDEGRYVIGACAECGTKVARTWRSLCKDCP